MKDKHSNQIINYKIFLNVFFEVLNKHVSIQKNRRIQ